MKPMRLPPTPVRNPIQCLMRAAVLTAVLLQPSANAAEANAQSSAPAIAQGIPQEQDPALEAAKRAVRRRNFEEAVRIWQEAAARGSTRAQYRLSAAYRGGLGVPRDLPLALQWLKRAASGGDTEAQFELGSLYQSGTGIEPDRAQALEWLGRAARGGHKKAQNRIDALRSSDAFALGHSRVGAHRDQPQRALAQAIRVGDLESANEALARGAKANIKPEWKEIASPLLLAIEKRRGKLVRLLLQHGASPNEKSQLGETALILASRSGQGEIVRLLVEAGAQLETLSASGTSPLMEAARSGDDETLNTLLAGGANPRTTLPDGTSAADIARRFGHPRIANRLRKAGAGSLRDTASGAAPKSPLASATAGGLPPIVEAARRGDEETLRSLSSSGMDLHVVDADGDTALHRASEGGHLGAVRFLLSSGVSANAKGREGSTPLMRAMASQAKDANDVMQALLAAGADPNEVDKKGANVLRYAAFGASPKKLDMLREYKGPYSAAGFSEAIEAAAAAGRTKVLSALLTRAPRRTDRSPALCAAVSAGQPEAFDRLLSDHDLVLHNCSDGNHPLMLAVRLGREGFVGKLLGAGSAAQKAEPGGDTPLIVAAGRGYAGIVRQLLQAGADADHRGAQRITALQSAAANGQLEVVRILLESGADPRLRNDADERALDLARNAGHHEIARLIESKKTGWSGW